MAKAKRLEFSKKVYLAVGIAFALITAYVGVGEWLDKDMLEFYKITEEIFVGVSFLYYSKSGTENFMKIRKGGIVSNAAEALGITVDGRSDSDV